MPIPSSYRVDFSEYRKDLVTQALNRLLSQHYDKCVLKRFVAAIMEEAQALFDALIDLQEKRTLFAAEGENLDALGRIVGEARAPYQYDESGWLFADRDDQRPDSSFAWTLGAPFAAFVPVNDEQYRVNILARIVKNHSLTASVPELERLTSMIAGAISYEKTGPMEAAIISPSTLSATALAVLTNTTTDLRTDNAYMLPYPATFRISGVYVYAPGDFFTPDREEGQQCDAAGCGVIVPVAEVMPEMAA